MVDGIKDFYISTQILGCTESKTPRQKTTKLLQVAEKIANLYYSDEDEMDIHISTTMHEELQKGQVLSVENLGQKFFSKNLAAQEEFFERLSAVDISRDEELSLSERFQRKFQKQAIRTSSGVEIKIPTQVYSNADEIEFINNPDGTVTCNVLPLIFSAAGCIYILCGGAPLLIVADDPSFHFNLITVNALFGGFLYTNYSLLLGLLDNSIVEKVKNTKIISKRNSHILKGIIYATVSVIAGLYLVLVPTNGSKFLHAIYCFMQNAEISFMAFLIFYFLLSLKEMSVLVGAIHNDKGAKTDKEIKELKEKIQSKQNQ